jgi:hypothetical protein
MDDGSLRVRREDVRRRVLEQLPCLCAPRLTSM